ncbi:MAG: SPOR domain-containing protein [bacterium]|nr:SPOR domain-containing protein [bacterium]
MEHFEGNPGPVKEKNVYFLQLNPPRIILIVSAVLGVIIIAFLLGMNFINKGNNDSSSQNDILLSENKGMDMLNRNIPAPPHKGEIAGPVEEKLPGLEDNSLEPKTDTNSNIASLSEEKSDNADVLTNENIDEIISSSKKDTKIIAQEETRPKEVKRKSSTRKAVAKKPRNTEKRKAAKNKTKKKSRVVEVSSKKRYSRPKAASGYAVQIASYDKRSRALSEISSLKKMHFDAFINKKRVKGKNFYRVRVGPISSKRKAIRLLNDIQEYPRYEGSYMVKE